MMLPFMDKDSESFAAQKYGAAQLLGLQRDSLSANVLSM